MKKSYNFNKNDKIDIENILLKMVIRSFLILQQY